MNLIDTICVSLLENFKKMFNYEFEWVGGINLTLKRKEETFFTCNQRACMLKSLSQKIIHFYFDFFLISSNTSEILFIHKFHTTYSCKVDFVQFRFYEIFFFVLWKWKYELTHMKESLSYVLIISFMELHAAIETN